ncbi:MAG: phosphoheptose isomerase [Bacteroidetes bacterium]|nr:phosphoheptose isomerase [Bacteroidota bacterium]MDA1085037.1 phosphoheptose isomerase [Bacteroidota bacterium]
MDTYKEIKVQIEALGFTVVNHDFERPWGGFLVIDEAQAQDFANHFFSGIDVDSLRIGGKLSPKILIVAPQVRLSWQYHHRRAEIWRVYKGTAGIIRSSIDEQAEVEVLNEGDQVRLQQGERHRLVGLQNHALIAEIWQHTDVHHPSDEDDIVRVSDDFGR